MVITVFRNGQKSNKKFVLNSAEVVDLKVLEVASSVTRTNAQTAVPNSKSNADFKNGKEDSQKQDKAKVEPKKPQNKEKPRPEQVNGSRKNVEGKKCSWNKR